MSSRRRCGCRRGSGTWWLRRSRRSTWLRCSCGSVRGRSFSRWSSSRGAWSFRRRCSRSRNSRSLRSSSRFRRRPKKRRRRQYARLIQLHQHNQKKNPRHHRANKKQHDPVDAARQQPAREVPNDAPKSQQYEETANRADLKRRALRRHSQFPPGHCRGHRLTLSKIIQAKRIGICATVACISHFARTLARCRFAHNETWSRIIPSTSAPKK